MIKQFITLLLFTFIWQLQAQQSDFKTINFEKADQKAMLFKGRELHNLHLLVNNLTYNLKTDVERFRAIYIWVCNNIESDYDLMLKNNRKRAKLISNSTKLNNWNTTFKKEVFNSLIKDKKTLCSGYAYLVKKLANLAGLECEIINGYGKTSTSFKSIKFPNHAWNAIKLNNKWYLCDATWSSGFITEDFTFKFNYNNDYFLMHPEDFAKSHKPLDEKWFLLNEKIK